VLEPALDGGCRAGRRARRALGQPQAGVGDDYDDHDNDNDDGGNGDED
jgi:hypothetical protein